MTISQYANVRLRDDAGRQPGDRFAPVKVLTPPRCEHGETICAECIEQWSWDHDLRVPLQGARRLLEDGAPLGELPRVTLIGRARQIVPWGWALTD